MADRAEPGLRVDFAAAERLLPQSDGKRYAEVLTRGQLYAEIYAPRGTDPQQPHARDEVYIVVKGHGTFVCGEARTAFAPGDLLFVPAGVPHRFEDFSDDFATWVIFYGADGGEPGAEIVRAEAVSRTLR